MILSIEGDEATGKTTLALSAPLPIVSFQFDMGIERAIKGGKYEELFAGLTIEVVPYDKNPEGKSWDSDITIFELPQPIQIDAMRLKGNSELWTYFVTLIAAALGDPKVATIVVDTMTIARRTKANAHLEGLQQAAYDANGNLIIVQGKPMKPREQLIQIEYGKVNDSIRDVYTTGAGVKWSDGRAKNLIAVHHLTDKRVDHVGPKGEVEQILTGEKILEGLAQTHRFVDIAILTRKENKEIQGELLKCGYSLSMEGMVLADPTWNSIASAVSIGTGERIELDRRNSK